MSILIVDDDFGIRATLAQVLEDEGYQVETAADGSEALDLLQHREAPPCVILLDLMMPIINGWEFRAAQKQHPTLAEIPVVILSADHDIRRKAASVDADAYCAKPIDLDRLLDTVGRFCHST